MFWQLGLALAFVVAAAGYLVWSWSRTWRAARGKGCSAGCGCAGSSSQSASERIAIGTSRLR